MSFKILFTFICIAAFTTAQCQRIGIKGNVNFTTARVYDSSEKVSTEYKPGFGIGVMSDIEFDGKLHFTPSVMYNMKGFTFTPDSGLVQKVSTSIHYIDLMAVLSYQLSPAANHFSINAGPTASIAISGKQKITAQGITTSSKMNFALEKDYGYFDLGMYFGASYSLNKFLLHAGYQLNFININNNSENDKRNIRNRMISLGFGYFLR